jgi:HlyD family secretion protein
MEELKNEQAAEEGEKKGLFQKKSGAPKKSKKKWVILAVVLVVLVAAGALALRQLRTANRQSASVTYTESAVEVRSITRTLTSSGTLQPADSYTVSTLVSGEILSDTFEEGDQVEKGQLLYTLDSSNATSSLSQSQNSLTQAQSSYNQAVKSKYPTADMTGTVKEVYVRNGDTVNAGTELLKIVGDDNIYMDFLFSYVDSSSFYVGQSATLFIDGFEGTLTGTVEAVSQGGNVDSSGRVNTTVRVKAVNPGLVTSSATASAVIGSYTSYGSSAVNIAASSVITASASGKVSGLSLMAGDTVTSGDRICTLTGDNIDNSIENAKISLSNAQNNLSNAQDTLDNYKVTAPISGMVVTKSAKAGDKIEGGSSGTLCTIYDLSYLEMTMSIDELDIGDVEVGQTVQVTADAVEGRTYTGVVTRVSVAGSTAGGITTYPVTVRIDEIDGLRPGMNVDAEIVISQSDNALAIPSAAVNRGNTVLLTADSPSAANAAGQETTEGYVSVEVTTGIDDDSYIEITSGLQEGDVVAYIQTSSGGADMMGGMMMGGGDMMGGGGMPSGGGGGGGGAPGGGGGGAPGGGGGF